AFAQRKFIASLRDVDMACARDQSQSGGTAGGSIDPQEFASPGECLGDVPQAVWGKNVLTHLDRCWYKSRRPVDVKTVVVEARSTWASLEVRL
ncbi:MAG TPA: hypothetical protein VD738_08290, partial [Nitrospira sp.]|nr:hypothetical protein [Nitrospira sp.]